MNPNFVFPGEEGGELRQETPPASPRAPDVDDFAEFIPQYPNTSYAEFVAANNLTNDDDDNDDIMAERPTTPRQGGSQMPNGTGAALMVASGLPHAGYQQDVNHVYELLGELSEVLRQNREATQHVRESVVRLSTRAAETGQQASLQEVNAELNGSSSQKMQANLQAQVARLTSQVEDLTAQLETARRQTREMNEVNQIYQDTMTTMMGMIRTYVYNKEMEIIAIHRRHNDELQALKDDNLEMRLEHSRWQEGLGRAMESSRQALRAVTDYESPYITERAELREENRMLRWELGFRRRYDDPAEDTDEEEGGPTDGDAVPQNDETSDAAEAPTTTEEPSTNNA